MRDGRMMEFGRSQVYHGDNEWSEGYIVELIIRLALVAVFIWAVVVVVRFSVKYLSSRSVSEHEVPEVIAKRRFASGEITKPEYEQLKKDLK